MNLTPQQQKILIDLLINVGVTLWNAFGKDIAHKLFLRIQAALINQFGDLGVITKIFTLFEGAKTIEEFDAARHIIVDDQCIPVKEGECVTTEGWIDRDCDGVPDKTDPCPDDPEDNC